MQPQEFKLLIIKWTKRILLTFVWFIVFIILIGIFFWEKQKWNNAITNSTGSTINNGQSTSKIPKILGNTGVVSTSTQKPDNIKNMWEGEKKRIYWEYMTAQRRAASESLVLFPTKKQMENIKAYIDYENNLREQYYQEVAKKNNLSYEDLTSIVDEANIKMWQAPTK